MATRDATQKLERDCNSNATPHDVTEGEHKRTYIRLACPALCRNASLVERNLSRLYDPPVTGSVGG